MNKNRIMQTCILTAGILLASQGFSHGGYHGGYHGYHGYHGGYHGYHNGYYGHRGYYGGGYYGGYGGYYGPGYYPLPIVVGGARYYRSCYFIKKCRYHHCWRQKVCR